MTEVDSQCLRKGTTRMPQKILKQLLQTAGQHLGVLRGSVCQSLGMGTIKIQSKQLDMKVCEQFFGK